MGTVTYPDPQVIEYVMSHFIPVQFNLEKDPGAMERFNSMWTPTIIVFDADGREHRRSSGYLDPKRFIGEMALARVMAAIDRKELDSARTLAREAEELCKGDPEREPEALYWSSVVAYKSSHDPNRLVEGWNRLMERFPQSEWARRAEFIRR